MQKLWVFVILAILSNEALGMSYRNKRQNEEDGSSEEDLEDRYGWNRPNGPRPQRPSRPNSNPRPRPPPVPRPLPDQGQGQTTTTTAAPNAGNQANVQACIRTCLVTTEYNPVCGSNNITYDNPSRLNCAQACGVNVTLLRSSRCPATTPAPIAQ